MQLYFTFDIIWKGHNPNTKCYFRLEYIEWFVYFNSNITQGVLSNTNVVAKQDAFTQHVFKQFWNLYVCSYDFYLLYLSSSTFLIITVIEHNLTSTVGAFWFSRENQTNKQDCSCKVWTADTVLFVVFRKSVRNLAPANMRTLRVTCSVFRGNQQETKGNIRSETLSRGTWRRVALGNVRPKILSRLLR